MLSQRKTSHFLSRLLFGGNPYTVRLPYVVLLSSLYFACVLNTSFFGKVLEIYPLAWEQSIFLVALFLILFCLTAFLLTLLCQRFTTKPILISLFIICSLSNYFMGTYGIVMNTDMLINIAQTSPSESLDLASSALVLNLLFGGLLPSYILLRLRIDYGSFKKEILSRLVLSVSSLALIAIALFSASSTFASFFREHKSIRYDANPIAFIYALGKIATQNPIDTNVELIAIAQDARIEKRTHQSKLVIFVVGETARADRFSLNGYERNTNPLLSQEDIINFPKVMSSGTSTATSVPCMFSHLNAKGFDAKQARQTENLLDVLNRVGVSVLWRDNNSDSKGVAPRVTYEDYKDDAINPEIEGEPRDEGMLIGLEDYIDDQTGDIFIVLHQMGSHGPAYYKRYPKAFEVFTPVCESNQLEKCSLDEINNAYDNTILYTDYFLSKVISLLKEHDADYETAMLYFSDHGESLGENNMYLHGYPYAFAPIQQKHVPAILWFGQHFPVDKSALKEQAAEAYSHDNIFHTVLGLFDVKTEQRLKELDIVANSNAHRPTNINKEALALAQTDKRISHPD